MALDKEMKPWVLGKKTDEASPGPDNGEPGGVLDSLALAYPAQSQRA